MPTHPMPSGFQEIYVALRTEVTWLHARWKVYSQLFFKSDKRLDLLNECARSLFYFVHETLVNDLLLTLCKVSDPAKQGKNDNLSLKRLQDYLDQSGDPVLAKECNATLQAIDVCATPLRVLRNKQLAHLDLAVALTKGAQPLQPIAKHQIDEALELLRTYLNAIERHYNDSEWGYQCVGMMGSDGDALVHVLRDGLRYEQLVSDEVVSYDDFQQNPWTDA